MYVLESIIAKLRLKIAMGLRSSDERLYLTCKRELIAYMLTLSSRTA
jgi:hypothetical protein